MCFTAIAGLAGSLIAGDSAGDAADAQTAAAQQDIALRREIYDDTTERFAPFYDSGLVAQNALAFEYGLGPRPTIGGKAAEITEISELQDVGNASQFIQTGEPGQGYFTEGDQRQENVTRFNVNGELFDTRDAAEQYANANPTGGSEYGGYTKTPGYDFRLQQGVNALDASAASRGKAFSGANQKAQIQYGQDYGSNEYNNFLSGLRGMASNGQNAAGQQAAAGQNFAQGNSNALSNIGNAQAAGSIAQGNAWNSGIQNALGAYQYQQTLNRPNAAVTGAGGLY